MRAERLHALICSDGCEPHASAFLPSLYQPPDICPDNEHLRRALSALVGRVARRATLLPLAALSAGLPVALGGGHVDIALRSRDVWTGAQRAEGAEDFGWGRGRPGFTGVPSEGRACRWEDTASF